MSATIPTISAEEYLKLQKQGSVTTLDCTIDRGQKDGTQNYSEEHIKGSKYFPYLELCSEGKFPCTMPQTAAEFATKAGKLGIKRTDKLVIYDRRCFFSSPRATFMLRTYSHPEVVCLDSYDAYKQLGGETESGPDTHPAAACEYTDSSTIAELKPKKWFQLTDIVDLYESGDISKYNLIDVRSPERYAAGHLFYAVNIFYELAVENGKYKSSEQIKELLKGIDVTKPTIIYCNSGITACILKTAVDEFLLEPAIIYDGSWSEFSVAGPKKYISVQ